MLRRSMAVTVFAVLCAAVGVQANAPASTSSDVANELASLMTQQKLDAFAAQNAEVPSRFVAVLLIPNIQLLAVSAEYPVPDYLTSELARRNYRDVYAALHQPVSAPTRFFVIDLGCDGLRGDNQMADILYENGVTRTLFNGDWKSQDLTEAVYRSRMEEAERRYKEILSRLVESLKGAPLSDGATRSQTAMP